MYVCLYGWMLVCLHMYAVHVSMCAYFLYTCSKHTVAHSLFRIHVVADIFTWECVSVCVRDRGILVLSIALLLLYIKYLILNLDA